METKYAVPTSTCSDHEPVILSADDALMGQAWLMPVPDNTHQRVNMRHLVAELHGSTAGETIAFLCALPTFKSGLTWLKGNSTSNQQVQHLLQVTLTTSRWRLIAQQADAAINRIVVAPFDTRRVALSMELFCQLSNTLCLDESLSAKNPAVYDRILRTISEFANRPSQAAPPWPV